MLTYLHSQYGRLTSQDIDDIDKRMHGGTVGGVVADFQGMHKGEGYEGGGHRRDAWRRHEAEDTQIRVTLY